MRFSSLVDRIGGEGVAAWAVHDAAMRARAAGEDVIVASVGDPDFDSPAAVIEECVAALRRGDTHYTGVAGRDRLRAGIARRWRARTGLDAAIDNVAITAGCQNALFVAAQATLGPGDEVIVPEPMYVTYEATLRAGGGVLVPIPSPREEGFLFRPDDLRAAISPKTRAIAVASPCNPTGAMLGAAQRDAIAEVANAHDLWVLSDEVYAEVVFEGEHAPLATLPGMAARTATLSSLSKSHAMPGWRVGWAIGPESLIAHMERYALCSTYGLPGFVQEGAAIAFERDLDEPARMMAALRRRRGLLAEALQGAPGVEVLVPSAGMFALLDVRGTGLDGGAFSRALFEAERVSVLDAAAFGPSAGGCVRFCFAMDEDALIRACARIRAFADNLAAQGIAHAAS